LRPWPATDEAQKEEKKSVILRIFLALLADAKIHQALEAFVRDRVELIRIGLGAGGCSLWEY
jgi:hypothetical protein